MAKVHVSNVVVLNNPTTFLTAFQFEITFECIEELKEDLEWKIIYVGSAESESHDQTLDSVFVGPVPEGRHMFVFQADPPDTTKIPQADAVGVTVVLLTCSYRNKEFVRIGYYVNNEYSDPEMRENPPTVPQYDKLVRNILATQPRVTRFKIEWDDKPSAVATGVSESNDGGMADEVSALTLDGDEDHLASADSNLGHNTGLHMNMNISNGNGMHYGRDRLSADSTSSLSEPPGPLLTTASNFLGSGESPENSLSTPMEVI
jgi:histone chaperone ASF1